MTNADLATGAVWLLWSGETEVARLTVTDTDFPWVLATIEELPAFEPFRSLFSAQEAAAEAEDWERSDELYSAVREKLRMTYPNGGTVAEFLLNVHGDGTCGWRWSDEPFED